MIAAIHGINPEEVRAIAARLGMMPAGQPERHRYSPPRAKMSPEEQHAHRLAFYRRRYDANRANQIAEAKATIDPGPVLRELCRVEAEESGLPLDALLSGCRLMPISNARWRVWARAVDDLEMSTTEIAEAFKVDNTAVINALRNHRKRNHPTEEKS